MVDTFLRRPVRLALGLAVVAALTAALAVAAPLLRPGRTSASGLEIPPIDGDPTDLRDRHVVTLDASVLDVPDASEPSDDASRSLVAPGRATSMGGTDDAAADLTGGRVGEVVTRAELDLATAFADSDARLDEVTAIGHGYYAVVSDGLGTGGLHRLPGVVSVEQDPLAFVAADDHFGKQWALENTGQEVEGVTGRVDADIDWIEANAEATGAGVLVAVLDSGIDATIATGGPIGGTTDRTGHSDLPALWDNTGDDCPGAAPVEDDGDSPARPDDCSGWDFVNDDNTIYDAGADNTHGTAVAGVLAGIHDSDGTTGGITGVAPDVDLLSVKIVDGGSFPSSRAAMAIDYAVAKGADIINASWTTAPGDVESTPLKGAIDRAADAGVLIVAAAGNNFVNIDNEPLLPASYDADNVLTVGANDATDHVAADYSNYGPEAVDVFAPGTAMMTTIPGDAHGYRSGTSMAAPVVTGIAAMVLEQQRAAGTMPFGFAELKQAVLESAVPDTVYAGLATTGGRVNAARALGLQTGPDAGALAVSVTRVTHDKGYAWLEVDVASGSPVVDLDLTLGRLEEDTLRPVVDHLVKVTKVDPFPPEANNRLTDEGGQRPITMTAADRAEVIGPDGFDLNVAAELPAGRYALMFSGTWDDAGTARDLTSAVVLFTVGDPDSGGDEPAPTPGPTTEVPAASEPDEDPPATPVEEDTSEPDPDFDTDLRDKPEPTAGSTEAPTDAGTDDPGDGSGGGGGTTSPGDPDDEEPTEAPTEAPTAVPDEDAPAPDGGDGDGDGDGGPKCAGLPVHEYVSPNCGLIDGGEVVTLRGDFNGISTAYVHFGEGNEVTVNVQIDTHIQVTAPPRVEPGTVDILIYTSATGATPRAEFPSSYTYIDPDAPAGAGGGATGGGGAGGGDGGAGGGGSGGGGAGGGGAGGGGEPAPPPDSLDNGLTLGTFPAGHPMLSIQPSAWRTNGCDVTSSNCSSIAVRT